jgi:hypothetical protein
MNASVVVSFALAFRLALMPGVADAAATPAPNAAAFSEKLVIYLARGAQNACGPGCDRWIAVEGKVDADAAPRVRRFLRSLKDGRRPIYFYSPGGSVPQAFAIGRLLRSLKATARVGLTTVPACAGGTQFDDACLKIKGGGEVAATVASRRAVCASSCVYMLLGATTREIAPDAVLGVHHSKLTMLFHGHPSAQQRSAATARSRDGADRDLSAFIRTMGISHDLFELTESVPFESIHLLTRSELFRFRIDMRPLVQTVWSFETSRGGVVRKLATVRDGDGPFVRAMEWRLYCEGKNRVRLMFLREFDKDAAGTVSVALTAGAEKPPSFEPHPARLGTYEAWTAVMAADDVDMLVAVSRLEIGVSVMAPDGTARPLMFEIETAGLEEAWAQLKAVCAAVPGVISNQMAFPVAGPGHAASGRGAGLDAAAPK